MGLKWAWGCDRHAPARNRVRETEDLGMEVKAVGRLPVEHIAHNGGIKPLRR